MNKKAFTLIELLVVIAIVAIVVGMIAPFIPSLPVGWFWMCCKYFIVPAAFVVGAIALNLKFKWVTKKVYYQNRLGDYIWWALASLLFWPVSIPLMLICFVLYALYNKYLRGKSVLPD